MIKMNKKQLITEMSQEMEALLGQVPQARINGEYFSTEGFIFLAAQSALNNTSDELCLSRLERLCKKVDVQNKLRIFYKTDLSTPLCDDNVDSIYAKLLCAVLLFFSLSYNDYKFLNTGIKMINGVLLEPKVEYEMSWNYLAEETLSQLQMAL